MKQERTSLKIVMIVLAVMVVSYILYNVFTSLRSEAATNQAVLYSAADSCEAEGFLIRREQVLPADFELVLPIREEGEKVAAGTEVALSLRSMKARDRQDRILQIRQDLAQLELAMSYQSQLKDNAAVTAKIDEASGTFAAQIAKGRLDSAIAVGQSLKSLVLRRELGTDDTAAIQAQINSLNAEMAKLQEEAAGEANAVTVPHAGYYSLAADGYEELLTPESIDLISIDAFRDMWLDEKGPELPHRAAGRLIDSPEWYFAALVDTKRMEKLHLGDTLTLVLPDESRRELEMTVTRLERSGGEKGLLVLRCDRRLSDISDLRRMRATLVFNTYSGVRVPREALCINEEDELGVYILENGKAVWKQVELVYDLADAYIVTLDQTSTYNLWPGDLILLDTDGLYDGKAVQ